VNPDRYEVLLAELKKGQGRLTQQTRQELAVEAFQHTARYDAIIANYLGQKTGEKSGEFPELITPVLSKVTQLRYGENPHQKAAFYQLQGEKGVPEFTQIHGKELSYNNIVDLEAAALIVREFDQPSAAIIKHTNPCGAALGETLASAYQRAHDADPVSAFGSIVGLNQSVDLETATLISNTFVEVVVAPQFDDDAVQLLSQKPSIRLIQLNHLKKMGNSMFFRYVDGGFLLQTPDIQSSNEDSNVVTQSPPSQGQMSDLQFAFKVIKYVKSNAIVVVKDLQVVGVGAGQMSRVEAVEIALKKAGEKSSGAVLASDAFFPFDDSVKLAGAAGIQSIIQPGGSKRDQDSIDCCNDLGVSMVFTGVRHFRH
ncbi:MAG: bifunctional phosphoribosylaminoimidazolecarboxamide formyltransferase/IMP cyclohydrolase PurH, partial [Actinobacteria bacterium]|nr:bifunctional phosphoribosylaminoimidazolecarboxamide formyltransferase/IMP cyclohydrolase PurH [Actinomycetota bacterium]